METVMWELDYQLVVKKRENHGDSHYLALSTITIHVTAIRAKMSTTHIESTLSERRVTELSQPASQQTFIRNPAALLKPL